MNPAGHPALARIRRDVQGLHAYAVQDSAGLVKLDAMENPHPLPPALQAELGRRLGAVALHRYPGDRVADLRRALADYADLPAGWSLMLGNGSDELISLVTLACDVPAGETGDGRPPAVLAPEPGFVMYAFSAHLQGLRFVGVPLRPDDFGLDVDAMVDAIRRENPAIVYLAWPNNPTAGLWDDQAMGRVIAAVSEAVGIVVIDEAYQPFAGRSWIDTIRAQPQDHAHVLLLRTLSKFGLAGVRIGYMAGPAELIAEIDKLRPPYNVSTLNAECALFALEHAAVFDAQAAEVVAERTRLLAALAAMPGVKAWPSDANMVLVRVASDSAGAARVFGRVRESGVLVKNVSTMHASLAGCLRLTVGTSDETARLLAALATSLPTTP
ncbi:pyridoxal phosphate-dependent aminotransferase [Xylophilus sp. GOD-11R]|uniref:pyridoxal phosphate-dependent aminotransferase n=1 Tax=Xylophilus sp. GOD-11R TaxID=3089814 RepID=UPI00298CCE97|nr:aminotransferase class I/II-fold pyridoxal phosphate-dependent enzyme [Xylophilus sp. GOD-11R]WPB57597.1 aminotransferase class I/II-fold pyridoxal phosphate-dependent enzyme [Xylophilus sp. GOD-11R]